MKKTIISIKNLTIPYIPESNIDLKVNEGEIVSIYGENGCGKTTLARFLAGLLRPEREGQILIDGLDLYDESTLCKLHRICSLVFQNPEDQIIYRQIKEEIAFGPENLGLPTEIISKRLSCVIDSMELLEKENISELSGGEVQRVALSDIFVMDPQILILDEATAMQDSDSRKRISDEIIKWARNRNRTVIFMTHLNEELALSDRIFEMKNGILWEVRKEEILNNSLSCISEIRNLKNIGENSFQGIHISEHVLDELNEDRMKSSIREINDDVTDKADHDMDAEIRCEDVTFSYGDTPVLKGFTFSFQKGHLYIVDGKTGTGKSTLAQLLNGLLPVDSGKITVDGQLVPNGKKNGMKRNRKKRLTYLNRIRKVVGYVAQYPEKQLFADAVLEDVMFAPMNMGYSQERAEELAKEALARLQVDEILWSRNPMTLSGGEKRRVAIAGILAMEPEYLILDESEAGLDSKGREVLWEIIISLLAGNKGVILISHLYK